MTYHIALVSSSRDIDAASVESVDKGGGVRVRYGTRHGSHTREAFAYELDAAAYSPESARAYMQGRGIDVLELRAAKADDYVEIEYEVARVGKWRPNVYDGQGKAVDAEIEFTAEMFSDMVESFSPVPNKLGHENDQSGARQMFDASDSPMGLIQSVRIEGEALIARAKVPASVKVAIDAKLLLQRSIEAVKRAGKWMLTAVAWLKNDPPAVSGMPDGATQVSASIFASARLVLADAVTPPGGPDVQDGEDNEPEGTTPEGEQIPDPDKGEETDTVSEELKAQNAALLASYRTQAGRMVDDLVGRKLTPAQGEAAKKLIANMSDTAGIDAQIEFLRASADIPKQTQQGDTTPAKEKRTDLDEAAEIEQKIAASTGRIELDNHEARLMAAAKRYQVQHPGFDFGDALLAVSRYMPDDSTAYIAATGRGPGKE